MDNNNITNQKNEQKETPQDPILSEMQKINFSLSEIASSLAFFKWLTVIIFALSILGGIIIFYYTSTQLQKTTKSSEEWRGSSYI